MLSHEELKEQCVLLYIQKECDDQGIEVSLELAATEQGYTGMFDVGLNRLILWCKK